MKAKFIIEKGNIGSSNEKVILSGVEFPDKVPVTKDFEASSLIGYATIEKKSDCLMAYADLVKNVAGFPAIGFKVEKEDIEEIDGVRIIKKCRIMQVSICQNPNCDPTIQFINI